MAASTFDEKARGKWTAILEALGIDPRHLRNTHGPCPICGGKDRFRYDNLEDRGTWICNQCGAGDGTALAIKFLNADFRSVATRIDEFLDESRPRRTASDDQNTDVRAGDLWRRGVPLTVDNLAGRYLMERTGLTEFPEALRYSSNETMMGRKFQVLVARIDTPQSRSEAGNSFSVHRTFLDHRGGKASLATPRMMLGSFPEGGAVELAPASDVMGIAEGIETALSAEILFDIPCWAALTAGNMQKWAPPQRTRRVLVFGDNDSNFVGQTAAFALARRLSARRLDVEVHIPELPGDWNDVLLAEARLDACRMEGG